ncbi:MAG: hypothetical protein PHE55_01355 [Methylococcaceae bacterium]|nr:hypothetical protein [Methylococcaceae bacterium]
MQTAIARMLPAILRLPNPENSQPWDIVVRGHCLEVFHTSERDRLGPSPDDLCVLGLGMIAEAISLAASTEGLSVRLSYFLEGRCDREPWLRAELEATGCRADPLAAALTVRLSDRRRYAGGSLADPVFREVEQEESTAEGVNLHLTDRYPAEFLAQVEAADRLIFEIPDIRHDFMRWTRFTDKQILSTRDGMPWRAFLRQPERWYHYPQSRLWWLATCLDWFPAWMMRFEEFLFDDSGRPSPAGYDDCAALGCITTASDRSDDLVAAGRLALRIWLLLNLRGYSFQAMTNVTCIAYPQRLGRWEEPASIIPELGEAYSVLQNMFGFSDQELPIFCFRTGRPIGPFPEKARSLRRDDRVRWAD